MIKQIKIASAPLGAIRAFEAAARHGSFKLAAQELSVTPAAISHQLSALEEYLGTSLFIRSNRLVQLSPIGKTLAEQVTKALLSLQNALQVAAFETKPVNTLVVSAAPSLAAKWLVPRLHRFHAMHPDIDLRLSSENQKHDLIRDASVDVVLRYGQGNYVGLHSEKLWDENYVFPVCSPATRDQADGKLQQLIDLRNQTLLRLPLPPDQVTNEVGERWQAWLRELDCEDKQVYQQVAKGPFYSHEHLAIDTARSGHGISLAVDILAIEDLLSKQLVRPLPLQSIDPYAFWLLYRNEDDERVVVKAFRDWIRAEAQISKKTLQSCRSQVKKKLPTQKKQH
jgi:LysR family glycine cleavage system transcriptional activator